MNNHGFAQRYWEILRGAKGRGGFSLLHIDSHTDLNQMEYDSEQEWTEGQRTIQWAKGRKGILTLAEVRKEVSGVHESSPLTVAQMLTSFSNIYMISPKWDGLLESEQAKAVVTLEGDKNNRVTGHVPLSPVCTEKQEECSDREKRLLGAAFGTQYYSQFVRHNCDSNDCRGHKLSIT